MTPQPPLPICPGGRFSYEPPDKREGVVGGITRHPIGSKRSFAAEGILLGSAVWWAEGSDRPTSRGGGSTPPGRPIPPCPSSIESLSQAHPPQGPRGPPSHACPPGKPCPGPPTACCTPPVGPHTTPAPRSSKGRCASAPWVVEKAFTPHPEFVFLSKAAQIRPQLTYHFVTPPLTICPV